MATTIFNHIEYYPLTWPDGWVRTPTDQRSSENIHSASSFYDERGMVYGRLGFFQPARSVLSTNIPIPPGSLTWLNKREVDSIAYKTESHPNFDPGAALYFRMKGIDYVVACDQYTSVHLNVAGINYTLECLTYILRHAPLGLQYRILWAIKTDTAIQEDLFFPWWEVLEVSPTASKEIVKAAYKVKAKQAHPDSGGSHEQMQRVNKARDIGLAKGNA